MSNNSPNVFQVNLPGLQSGLTIVAICLLLGSLGLGWVVKSALAIVAVVIFAPVVGFLGFFWWLRRSIVQAACPVCAYPLQGIDGNEVQCSNCGEVLKVDRGRLIRETPPDTIDVVAVEVTSD